MRHRRGGALGGTAVGRDLCAAHAGGSSDKLYEITPDLKQIIRPESIGGTPANRMIHRESQQLFIGPYAIDARRHVRVIPYAEMFGRPTGNARHLTDPANLIYCASMEEGLYEVDVHTLAVTELWRDEQQQGGRHADLPGYHGKGLYSGQGRVVYANNGDHAAAAMTNPAVPSGVLAEWDGKGDAWTVVRRNQFTEVYWPGRDLGKSKPGGGPTLDHWLGSSVADPDGLDRMAGGRPSGCRSPATATMGPMAGTPNGRVFGISARTTC